MRTVLDASVGIPLLARLTGSELLTRHVAHDDILVPAHFDAEVLHGLRRLCLAGVIGRAQRDRAIQRLQRLPAERVPLAPLLADATARLGSVSGYDALYLACVLHTNADRLLTRDRRLAMSPAALGTAITVV